MQLVGFENWRPAVDVPELNRPQTRPDEMDGDGRVAAVMLLLYSRNISAEPKDPAEDLKIVFTKRHPKLTNHAGQISFPGGQQDKGESLWQTAIRETFEEIGVDSGNKELAIETKVTSAGQLEDSTMKAQIQMLGSLNSVYIPPSDFTVNPFVAWYTGQPKFIRSEHEVDEIIEASVSDLLNPSILKYGNIRSASGMNINVPFYEVGPHRIWGATALILGELIERIRRVQPT